jgi:hypothetical protein
MFAEGHPAKEVAADGAEEVVLEVWLCVEVVEVALDEELYQRRRISEYVRTRPRSKRLNNAYLGPEFPL